MIVIVSSEIREYYKLMHECSFSKTYCGLLISTFIVHKEFFLNFDWLISCRDTVFDIK